ncbi:MAG: ATP-binding protein [Candidatus Diapherotrites archaeon]|nr:ATP-binding protein [Candidatus Diapherotrites archaeon]
MDRTQLRFVINDQQKTFESENPFVKREALSELDKLMKLKMPVVITGVRRSGKSFIMKQFKDSLNLTPKQFLYIDFNDERLSGFKVTDFQLILDFLVENDYEKKCLLFLDEIQEVELWEKWINRIKTQFRIIITGSNSKLLSAEISSTLTGRSLSINMMPFSFIEFLKAKKIEYMNYDSNFETKAKLISYFSKYFIEGGFPAYVLEENEVILRELYENILYRDIIKRFGKNEKQLRELSTFFLSNPTNKFSFRGISDLIGTKNRVLVKSFVLSFEKSLTFFFLPKFDYSIRKQIQNPQKVYCIDNGFLSKLGFRFSDNEGKLLENLVAIELKRRSQNTYYFNDAHECDFVIKEGNKIVKAIQVTTKISKENEEREIKGLLEAMNKFNLKEGLILTTDQEEERKQENKKIILKPVWKWLLEKEK